MSGNGDNADYGTDFAKDYGTRNVSGDRNTRMMLAIWSVMLNVDIAMVLRKARPASS